MQTYPAIEVPTGDAAAGLGNGRTWYRLPVWAQKSWGPWRYSTLYNVGGYLKPNDRVNVLFSLGHSVAGEDHSIGYVGLYFPITK